MKALEERPDLRYVSDIKPDTAEEFEHKFASRVFFTPKKMGAQTAEANFNAGVAAAEQSIAYPFPVLFDFLDFLIVILKPAKCLVISGFMDIFGFHFVY